MNKYDLIIFDVDGTLLDTREGIISAVKYTLEKYNLPKPSKEVLQSFIGPPIFDSFIKTYGIDNEVSEKMTEVFRNRYKDYDLFKAMPYSGIYDLLEKIRNMGINSAIATYKRQDYAEILIHHFGFDEYTKVIYGADNDNKLSKRDIIEKCILASRVNNYNRVLMVGDSYNDALGASQMKIDFLGVTYGFGFCTKEEIYEIGAIFAADKTLEILEFIEKG